MGRSDLKETLEGADMSRVRDLGYALEGPLGGEVRAQGRDELIGEILDAVDEIGEEAEPILEAHGFADRKASSGEVRIIQLLAYYPSNTGLRYGDLLVDPVDDHPPLRKFREVSREDAEHLVETGRARVNETYSQRELG